MFVDYPGGPTVTLLGSQVNDVALTELIGGHDATIVIDRRNDSAKVIPQASTGRIKETITLKGDGAMSERNHFANLFDAVRTGAPLNCPVELGYKVNVAIAMGVMAYRQKTAIAWDPKTEKAGPAANCCADAFIAAETKARTAAVGLWRDSFYAVLAVDGRSAFDKRSATVVLAEGRLTAVDAGPYRTKLRFAARDRTDRDVLAATILPRTMKLFETQGVTFSSLIGRTLRFRGLLDLRFGPEIELIGPDAVEILPAEPVPSTPEAAGHG